MLFFVREKKALDLVMVFHSSESSLDVAMEPVPGQDSTFSPEFSSSQAEHGATFLQSSRVLINLSCCCEVQPMATILFHAWPLW